MSPAVGQTRRGEGSSQGQVIEGARRQASRFGRRCRVICDREPGSGEEIKLSSEHRAIMMRTAASGSSILRGVVTSRQAAFGPARLLTVGDPDGGFVTALLRTSAILPKTVATAVNVTNPDERD